MFTWSRSIWWDTSQADKVTEGKTKRWDSGYPDEALAPSTVGLGQFRMASCLLSALTGPDSSLVSGLPRGAVFREPGRDARESILTVISANVTGFLVKNA